MTFKVEEFAARRARLLAQMPEDSIAIIRTNDEYYRNPESHFPFRPRSGFVYLTGFCEPKAIAVLIPNRPEGEFVLFNEPRDPEREIWFGKLIGQEGAIDTYGADQAFPIETIDEQIGSLLEGKQRVYYQVGVDDYLSQKMPIWIHALQVKVRKGIVMPFEFVSLDKLLHEMRLVKDDNEIAYMRQAATISGKAHRAAMAKAKPGMYEYELEAILHGESIRQGAREQAYSSIVAGGANACCLHYITNNQKISDGDLILIDAGAEFNYYAADITRTFPANGKFSPEQKAIYEAVLRVQLAMIGSVRPGVTHQTLQDKACKLITQELVDLGILQGDVTSLVKQGAYKLFYMHSIGHWLGLDVHDVGSYRLPGGYWRELKAGMVLTIEPGIYIAKDNQAVDPKWRGIGVRIEDDVLVTETGYDVLSHSIPKTVEEIETLVGSDAA